MDCSCIYVSENEKGWDFFQEQNIVAKKEHLCCECGKIIKIGELYRREGGKIDGDFETFKLCLDCVNIRDIFFCNFTYGEVWNDLRQWLIDGNFEIPGDWMVALIPSARDRVTEFMDKITGG